MEVDYIVVGAGTAGCVVAARLSENPSCKVLLIEAGGWDKKVEVTMPVGYPKLQKTKRDWQYETTPQAAINNRKFYQPRGKMIGGTGSMNGMIYVRGHRNDYDDWAERAGEQWSFENLLPFFRKSENNASLKDHYHHQNGLLPVTDDQFKNPLNAAFVEAAQSVGLRRNPDFNGESLEGAGFFQSNIKNGKRQSTARAFLYPALQRKNLTVMTHTRVVKINFEANQAIGIEGIQQKKSITITASKGVILCAGAINTPLILMRSGVGPLDELEKAGIPVQQPLESVGKHLQDHIQYFLGCRCKQKITLNTSLTLSNLFRYFVQKKGIFASGVCVAGGFWRSSPELDRPDIQFHFVPGIAGDDIHDLKNQPRYDGYMLGITLLQPKSRGEVQLNPVDHLGKPIINPGFLTDPEDMIPLVKGFDIGMEILNAPAFLPFRGPFVKPTAPLKDKKAIRSYILNTIESVYHSVGTCRMGKNSDSVVNENLEVHGLKSLYIADASIMPSIPSGNVNAAIIMIGEKMSSMLTN